MRIIYNLGITGSRPVGIRQARLQIITNYQKFLHLLGMREHYLILQKFAAEEGFIPASNI
ncbi:MAG: hypothetical protein IIB44_12550 [Candidatus Marinimicrobia bacterium]|nr:hypothetical protein [Candidatus Neomarinimicrobiota bacterium]MCH8069633.1 hypothetical protein [Candidatus Neomarinimicrobiota bacterium]